MIDPCCRRDHNHAMRVGIGQINAHVGAIEANTTRIVEIIEEAKAAGCDLIVFPELAVCGYSPYDLFWRDGFIDACQQAIARIRDASSGVGVIVGGIDTRSRHDPANRDNTSSLSDGASIDLFNRAYFFEDGQLLGTVDKQHLPAYDIYREKRYFTPGEGTAVHDFGGMTLGINICEDLWIDDGPTDLQASLGAEWIINLSASPYYLRKPGIRTKLAARRTKENGVGLIYVNLVGGQDEVVFDGGSFAFDSKGRQLFSAPRFREGLYVIDLAHSAPQRTSHPSEIEDIREALELGIRDYVGKNGFERVLIGLSGGIDSAVVAALASEALGSDNVRCIYMPTEFSSTESGEDAKATAERLGVSFQIVDVSDPLESLRTILPKRPSGLVDENLQPRLRGTILMALANQDNALVLCPGNKSEIAMGYNTLYGDTVGALAPIADLYKHQVIALAKSYGDLIPTRVLTKPPSAELRPHQRDDDDLPAYEILDPLLKRIVEGNASKARLLEDGVDAALLDDIFRRLRQNEYKRAQLPPGIKISPKSFGNGRWFPLTNGYLD